MRPGTSPALTIYTPELLSFLQMMDAPNPTSELYENKHFLDVTCLYFWEIHLREASPRKGRHVPPDVCDP